MLKNNKKLTSKLKHKWKKIRNKKKYNESRNNLETSNKKNQKMISKNRFW